MSQELESQKGQRDYKRLIVSSILKKTSVAKLHPQVIGKFSLNRTKKASALFWLAAGLQTCEWRQQDVLFTLHQKGEVESLAKTKCLGAQSPKGGWISSRQSWETLVMADGWWRLRLLIPSPQVLTGTTSPSQNMPHRWCWSSVLTQSAEFHTEDSSRFVRMSSLHWSLEKCFLFPSLSGWIESPCYFIYIKPLSIRTCSVALEGNKIKCKTKFAIRNLIDQGTAKACQ